MPSEDQQGAARPAREAWYRELVIRFDDGTEEHFYIELTQTGTYIPRVIAAPADWVRLTHHQCECCPIKPQETRFCPAAESIETTLLRLHDHFSYEKVDAIATDGANRETKVRQSLQEVGTALVHLAVFSSGCPVGKQFRPLLSDLRPFSTNEELSRHLVSKMVLKHRGRIEDSRQEMLARLDPLRAVFAGLCRRLPAATRGDAIANSIISLDAVAMGIQLELDEALNELATEMGWEPGAPAPEAPDKPPPPATTGEQTWWQRLKRRMPGNKEKRP